MTNAQLEIEVSPPLTSGYAELTCWHRVPFDPATHKRLGDNWWASVSCPACHRKRAVVHVAYPTPSDTPARLPRPIKETTP